ncbi:hypothetical protein JCM1840_001195 [Sporobolomyces johnsonii]
MPTDPSLSLPTHPSCFFRALSSLPSSSPCETLAHSDSHRTEIAVAMALCEISTSEGAKLPRECRDWQAKKGEVGGCVDSLRQHDLTSTVGETDAVARTVVRVMTEVQAAAQLAIASFATSLSSVEEQQAHLSGRLDLNLAQASELAAVLSNLTDQVRQRQHYEREGHSFSWEALEDVLWWIKLFFGFLQEGLGLKGLLISLLVVGFSLLYPSFAYVAGVLTMVLSLYRFLAFVRSLHRPFHHLLFPSKQRKPTTSSPLAPSSRTPTSPFAPPRSFRFNQPRTTAAVSPSSRTCQAGSAIATASRLARSAAVASGTSNGSAPQLYSGKSLIIGL